MSIESHAELVLKYILVISLTTKEAIYIKFRSLLKLLLFVHETLSLTRTNSLILILNSV
jgi:hypothetical protein